MTRYFFNTFEGTRSTYRDDAGEELSTLEAVWEMATHFAAECLRDLDGKLRFSEEWRLEVVRDDGKVLFRIHISGDEVDSSS